jgi:Tol biopolymer transport system component
MKRLLIVLCGMTATIMAAESGYDLFQKGLAKERAAGDLHAAIQIYRRVAAMPRVERKLAAEALFRMAECQQVLGSIEARKTYQRIIHDFGDQQDIVRRASERVSALKPEGAQDRTELAARRIWVPPSYNMAAGSISRDGRFLSYAAYFAGGDLALRDLTTGETRTVRRGSESFNEYPSHSVISPDQKKIAYTWKTVKGWELRIIDWDGSNERTLYANPEGSWLGPAGWSPDGREILVNIHTRSRTKQLGWVSVTGSKPRVLKTFPWQSLGEVQAVSPDGRYIAYDVSGSDGESRTIFMLASDGSRETPVTDDSAANEVFGWMPDAKALLFATNRTGSRELWHLPVHDGKRSADASVVKPDLGGFSPVGMSASGSLSMMRYVTEGQTYTASVDWTNSKVSCGDCQWRRSGWRRGLVPGWQTCGICGTSRK